MSLKSHLAVPDTRTYWKGAAPILDAAHDLQPVHHFISSE